MRSIRAQVTRNIYRCTPSHSFVNVTTGSTEKSLFYVAGRKVYPQKYAEQPDQIERMKSCKAIPGP